jgi:hypothetical protein
VSEFKHLGYTFNDRTTAKSHMREIVMMFESMVESLQDRDLGKEGTRGGRESSRKIFEMDARSGQRNGRLHSERRVQEE